MGIEVAFRLDSIREAVNAQVDTALGAVDFGVFAYVFFAVIATDFGTWLEHILYVKKGGKT